MEFLVQTPKDGLVECLFEGLLLDNLEIDDVVDDLLHEEDVGRHNDCE